MRSKRTLVAGLIVSLLLVAVVRYFWNNGITLPKTEIAKIEGKATVDDEHFYVEVYNGSSWLVRQAQFEVNLAPIPVFNRSECLSRVENQMREQKNDRGPFAKLLPSLPDCNKEQAEYDGKAARLKSPEKRIYFVTLNCRPFQTKAVKLPSAWNLEGRTYSIIVISVRGRPSF